MSERQRYSWVERYRVDTWAFIVFCVITAIASHW